MAQAPQKGPPPPRPPSPLSATAKICSLGRARTLNTDLFQCSSIYLLKKWNTEEFKLQRTAMKFSANIICCCSICLWKIRACVGRRVAGASKTLRRKRCGVNTAASTLRYHADPYGFAKNPCLRLLPPRSKIIYDPFFF